MTAVFKLFKIAYYLDVVVLCMEQDKNRFYVFIRGMKNFNLLAGKKSHCTLWILFDGLLICKRCKRLSEQCKAEELLHVNLIFVQIFDKIFINLLQIVEFHCSTGAQFGKRGIMLSQRKQTLNNRKFSFH
jgi:hypothetical protein